MSNDRNKIIGLLGHAGCGKDTVADMVFDYVHGSSWLTPKRFALADPLKRFCEEVFGFSDAQLYGPSEERNKPDLRYPIPVPKPGTALYCRKVEARAPPGHGPDDSELGEYEVLGAIATEDGKCSACGEVLQKYLTPRKALQTLGTDWGRALYEDVWVDYGLRRAKTLAEVSTNLFVVITDLRFLNEARKVHEVGQVWRITRPGAEGDGHASERDQDSRDIKPFIDVEILNNGTLDDLHKKVYAELEKLRHADQG